MNVELRVYTAQDAKRLAELANNVKIVNNVRDSFPHPYTLDHAQDWIEFCQKHPTLNQAILSDGQLAGGVGVIPGEDIHRVSFEVGYWLGEPYWGKGIATAALRLWIEKIWHHFPEAQRLWAGVFAHNPASMRVLEKAGFQPEAVLKNALVKNNLVEDEHLYALYKNPSPPMMIEQKQEKQNPEAIYKMPE
ncbi:MAG: GNAT family N-acetyltransferase [Siphonobacter sp.]